MDWKVNWFLFTSAETRDSAHSTEWTWFSWSGIFSDFELEGIIFSNPLSLVVVFSNLIHENGIYISGGFIKVTMVAYIVERDKHFSLEIASHNHREYTRDSGTSCYSIRPASRCRGQMVSDDRAARSIGTNTTGPVMWLCQLKYFSTDSLVPPVVSKSSTHNTNMCSNVPIHPLGFVQQ